MKDILMAVLTLAFFTVGYFAVDRYGKFVDENIQETQEPEEPGIKVFIAEKRKRRKRNKKRQHTG